ncbi:MAG: flagellar assembly peptidoglycan hydrolase FlgJ [Pseudomonadota bacterium]
MINDTSGASVYTDFSGLARLRAAAGQQSPEALRETARQFEALFVQSMLKAMRDASPGDGMFESDQTQFYRDIYDRQLALEMVKGRGLGIADMLVRSLGGTEQAAAPPAHEPAAASVPLVPLHGVRRTLLDLQGQTAPLVDMTGAATGKVATGPDADWRPQNPDEFIRELLPHARRGAAALGLDPAVIVAQAALETGWGQKTMRHPDGRNTFNLFGIKADPGWGGDKVSVQTLEFEDGVAVKKRAAFRSYASLDEAISGYVEFLRGNPRYRQALQQAGDANAYLDGLESAGYATDPHYAEKIRTIMERIVPEQGNDLVADSGAAADS